LESLFPDSFTFVSLTFKVVDARIDARPGNSTQQRWVPIKTRRWRVGLPASSFCRKASCGDTSFDNDKPASSSLSLSGSLACWLDFDQAGLSSLPTSASWRTCNPHTTQQPVISKFEKMFAS